MRPKKSLGQNFLTNPLFAEKISDALPNDLPILEIGPGKGFLTQFLTEKTSEYTGIELDKALFQLLCKNFQRDHIHFINGDILKENLTALFDGNSFNVAGNIPYNITTPILFHLLESSAPIQYIVLMVQKEVAERISAAPGNKTYGVLTIMAQYAAQVEYLFTVPSSDFYPKPKVDSAVIRIRVREWEGEKPENLQFFKDLVRTAFQKRRKMLRSSLKGFPLQEIDLDLTLRPEQLSINEWIHLSNHLYRYN